MATPFTKHEAYPKNMLCLITAVGDGVGAFLEGTWSFPSDPLCGCNVYLIFLESPPQHSQRSYSIQRSNIPCTKSYVVFPFARTSTRIPPNPQPGGQGNLLLLLSFPSREGSTFEVPKTRFSPNRFWAELAGFAAISARVCNYLMMIPVRAQCRYLCPHEPWCFLSYSPHLHTGRNHNVGKGGRT